MVLKVRISLVALMVLWVCAVSAPIRAQDGQGEVVNLSENNGASDEVRLAIAADGSVHALWRDDGSEERRDILHRYRTADGTWSATEILTADFDLLWPDSYQWLLRNPQGTICAYWAGIADSAASDTFGVYERCFLNGEWSATTLALRLPIMAADPSIGYGADGDVVAAYKFEAGSVGYVGQSGIPVILYEASILAFRAYLVINQGQLHVLYIRMGNPYSLEHRLSMDEGATWTDPVRITDDALIEGRTLLNVALTADAAGNVHVVVDTNAGFYHHRWAAATGWAAPKALIASGRSLTGINPALISVNNTLYLTWLERTVVNYSRQLPTGEWTEAIQIGSDVALSLPALTADANGTLHLAWTELRERQDVFYALIAPDSDTPNAAPSAGSGG
jgi:hypothetical protein